MQSVRVCQHSARRTEFPTGGRMRRRIAGPYTPRPPTGIYRRKMGGARRNGAAPV